METRIVDKIGVIVQSKKDQLTASQAHYAKADEEWKAQGKADSLLGVIQAVKPHVLIGTSTKPGAFTEEIVREMAKHVKRPMIFPLSNPTRLHEAKPEDLIKWTDGQALVATGSPFPPVEHNGKKIEIGASMLILRPPLTVVAECNNSVVFPGRSIHKSRPRINPSRHRAWLHPQPLPPRHDGAPRRRNQRHGLPRAHPARPARQASSGTRRRARGQRRHRGGRDPRRRARGAEPGAGHPR
jgi:hypothetical protein